MILDDGVVNICTLSNVAPKAKKPSYKLTPITRAWFGERTVGYNRQYLAKGVNEQVDMLIRIRSDKKVRIGQYAVLGNGEQFQIDNVAQILDEYTGLKMTEITLRRLEEFYEINTED